MISNKDNNYKLIFSDLDKFYKECDELELTGNEGMWKGFTDKVDPIWVGLSKDEIIKSKYVYKKGLDQLKSIEEDLNLGGTRRLYKWDENDGDDMDYDRYLDNIPCLKKRVKRIGNNHGRIVNIHVSIGENCRVTYKEMLNRSYTVMRIIDYLENLGYRIGVSVYTDTARIGSYNSKLVENLHTEIQIKKPEDPLIKGLILTCISPWMLRYHMFRLWSAKINVNGWLGQAVTIVKADSETDIYFPTGSCLNDESCENKIKELAEKFSFEE